MMAPAAPIICPPDYPIMDNPGMGGGEGVERTCGKIGVQYCFPRKSGVVLIAVLEIIGSLCGMTVYIYALAMNPDWALSLVPIPRDLCNADVVVRGVMYVIVLLCTMELLLSLYLLEGARQEKLGRIRFWLSSMLTYLSLVTVVILGMDLGGIRCSTMNSAAFINIFLRFLEILMVYAWAEQESMRRKLRLLALRRGTIGGSRASWGGTLQSLNGLSTLTICTNLAEEQQQNSQTIPNSPPPSYSETLPGSTIHVHPPPPRESDTNNIDGICAA